MSFFHRIGPCRSFRGRPKNQFEVRHRTRVTLEVNNLWGGTWMQVYNPLRISEKAPISGQATFDHLQDCCNKAVAIYRTPQGQNPQYIYDKIYQQWFHGHRTDVEFGTYLAKIIFIPALDTEAILSAHRSLCNDVVNFQKLLDNHDGATALGNRGMFDVNWKQRSCYHLRPLFRALIIVADRCFDGPQGDQLPTVRIIRTGHTEGLSAPVSFDSIPASESTVNPDNSMEISTTLSCAIRFMLALERREMDALPAGDQVRPLDQSPFGIKDLDWFAQDIGGSAEDLEGPSNKWVHCPGYGFPDPLAPQEAEQPDSFANDVPQPEPQMGYFKRKTALLSYTERPCTQRHHGEV